MIVSGYIYDNKMRPIGGAQVSEIGGFGAVPNSAFTNADGSFVLMVTSVLSQLRIVRAGYEVKNASASNFSFAELSPSDVLPEATVNNTYSKPGNNNLLYIALAVAAGIVITKIMSGPKPRKVTV